MIETSSLFLFIVATLVLLLTPGPSVLYIVTRSITQGRKAGLVSTLGIQVGALFHVVAAALGVSALLMSSVLAFSIVKYLGAAYLIYLGLRQLLIREELRPTEVARQQSLIRIFFQGVLVNVLNPKTALFFFAFLPQFVDRSQGMLVGQVLFLGCVFVVMATLSDGLYALLAGSIGPWLRGNLRFLHTQRYFAGSVYIGLGVTTALAGSHGSHKK